MKCLAKNPEDRYSDAKELLNDINWHISHDTLRHEPPHRSPDIIIDGETVSEECPPDTNNDGEETSRKSKPKTNKTKLLFIAGGCAILACLIIFYFIDQRKQEIIRAKSIYIPVKEYQLNIGDSIVIEGHINSPLVEDSIITWTPYDTGIVSVKGDTIIALKSGETVLNASIPFYTIGSAVKITVTQNADNLLGDNSSENNTAVSEDIRNYQDDLRKEEQKKTENPTKHSDKIVSPGAKRPDPNNKQQLSSINLGYGTWHGASKNGKPHGKGKIVFSSAHKVDRHSDVIANPGDYFEAVYENGQLVYGSLFDSAGNKKNTIVP